MRTCFAVLFVSVVASPCAAESGSRVDLQHASFHLLDYVALTGYLVVLVWIGNKLIDPDEDVGQIDGAIVCRERLGGLLNHYYRKAA